MLSTKMNIQFYTLINLRRNINSRVTLTCNLHNYLPQPASLRNLTFLIDFLIILNKIYRSLHYTHVAVNKCKQSCQATLLQVKTNSKEE